MTDLALPFYTVCTLEQLGCAWKAVKALNTIFSEHTEKTITCTVLDLVRRLQSRIDNLICIPIRFLPNWFCIKNVDEYGRFPYHEEKINEWFVQEFSSVDETEHKAVNIINVDGDGKRRKSYMETKSAKFPECLASDQFELFVHGTNHDNAKRIIEQGILLEKGEEAQDFSDGMAYYVGNDFDKAVLWARKKYTEGEAVLIYRVDKMELRGKNNDNGLDLRNDKSEWLRVVTEFRYTGSGARKPKPNKGYRKELKKQYEFIEGPMASVSAGNPRPSEQIGTYQLCVRTRNCALLFDRSLNSVVFFER